MGMATVVRYVVSVITSKRFVLTALAMFAASIGVLSGIVQILPTIEISARLSVGIIALAILFAVVYAWFTAKPIQLPADDVLPEDCLPGERFVATCVHDRRAVQLVNDLAAAVYPGVRPLPLDRYEQWLMINPHLLTCLFDPRGRVVGYFDVFPLRQDFMQMLVEGVCGEQDIRREHIMTPQHAAAAGRIYLGGIAVAGHERPEGRRHASMLVWALARYLQYFTHRLRCENWWPRQ